MDTQPQTTLPCMTIWVTEWTIGVTGQPPEDDCPGLMPPSSRWLKNGHPQLCSPRVESVRATLLAGVP